jgi:hypothetical protein
MEKIDSFDVKEALEYTQDSVSNFDLMARGRVKFLTYKDGKKVNSYYLKIKNADDTSIPLDVKIRRTILQFRLVGDINFKCKTIDEVKVFYNGTLYKTISKKKTTKKTG